MNEFPPGRRLLLLLPRLLCYVLAASPCPYLGAEDCNGNGREDVLDIARGESRDCNRDGVPDECQEERDLFFVTRERHEICGRPRDQAARLVSEDLDGDGDEDIAVVCSGRVLSLLWNRGDGSFEPVENVHLDMIAYEILCDDFDGDRDFDLMVVENGSVPEPQAERRNRMDLYRNDGSGGFQLAGGFDTGGFPGPGASGDLDGDSDPDVVLIAGDDPPPGTPRQLSVLRNGGDGSFEEPRRQEGGPTPRFPHIADVDGDGLGDIVTVQWTPGVITVLKNRGDLTFEGPELYDVGLPGGPGPGPATVDSGDLDGDGDLDLAVGNVDTTVLSLLFNDGEGGFEDLRLVNALGARDPNPVRVGDIDRDGDLDVLTSGIALFAYYNSGAGRLGPPVRFGTGRPGWPTLGDFDGDGWTDVAVTSFEGVLMSNTISLLRNRGGTFAATRTYPVNFTSLVYDATSIVALDLEPDGHQDLAVLNFNGFHGLNAVALLRNDGQGRFSDLEQVVPQVQRNFGPLVWDIHPLDADEDGDMDLLAAGFKSGPRDWGFAVLRNDGGELIEEEFIPGPGPGLAPADFDGDGRIDFAHRGAVFWNEGGLRLVEETVVPRQEMRCGEAISGDWDSDGLADVAFRCGARSDRSLVALYRNLGSRRFELQEKHEWGRTVLDLVSLDFDGDGDLDLAVGLELLTARSKNHGWWVREWGAVEVLRNDGRGRFELAAREPVEQSAGALHARDLDLDGDDDLVVSGGGLASRAEVKLLLSGRGGFEQVRTYPTDGQTVAAVAEDLDGDGHLDLAVTHGAQVSVLLNEAPRKGPDSGVRGCGGTFFRRGDLDGEGDSDFQDALRLLYYIFARGDEPGCLKAADVDDSGRLGVTDAVLLIKYWFGFVRELPAPFPGCGPDPTEDALSCKKAVACH